MKTDLDLIVEREDLTLIGKIVSAYELGIYDKLDEIYIELINSSQSCGDYTCGYYFYKKELESKFLSELNKLKEKLKERNIIQK